MKLPSIQQAIFYPAGLATSVASAWGTAEYLMHETGGDALLAGSAAVALGAVIYFSWDVVFNHTGKRRLAALLIAVTCTAASVTTIYQNNWLPEQQRQQAEQQQQVEQEATRQAAAKATLEQQQADTRAAIADLKAMQATDQAAITDRLALVEKGIRPNANNAAIATARETMTTRSQRITELQDRLAALTTQILTVTQQANPAHAPQETGSPNAADAVDLPRLARAALYDTMTILFMLLGSWYRNQRTIDQSAEVAGLQQAISQLNTAADNKRQGALQVAEQLEQRIQKAIYTCNETLAGVTESLTPVTKPATESLTGVTGAATTEQDQLSEKAAIILLENRRIKANDNGNLTAAIIQNATGWGRPRAKQLLEEAHDKGILARTAHGNAWVYSYATKQEQQLQLPGNVFQLSSVRTA